MKTLKFEYEGKKYNLCFTADSLKKMERMGMDFNNLDKQMLTLGEDLWCGAFIENHGDVSHRDRVKMYGEMSGEGLDEGIIDMFTEALTDYAQHKHTGNVPWEIQ